MEGVPAPGIRVGACRSSQPAVVVARSLCVLCVVLPVPVLANLMLVCVSLEASHLMQCLLHVSTVFVGNGRGLGLQRWTFEPFAP